MIYATDLQDGSETCFLPAEGAIEKTSSKGLPGHADGNGLYKVTLCVPITSEMKNYGEEWLEKYVRNTATRALEDALKNFPPVTD